MHLSLWLRVAISLFVGMIISIIAVTVSLKVFGISPPSYVFPIVCIMVALPVWFWLTKPSLPTSLIGITGGLLGSKFSLLLPVFFPWVLPLMLVPGIKNLPGLKKLAKKIVKAKVAKNLGRDVGKTGKKAIKGISKLATQVAKKKPLKKLGRDVGKTGKKAIKGIKKLFG